MAVDRKTWFLSFNLFVFFLSIFIFTSSPSNVYDTDAATARYEVTKSLVERHELSIPQGTGVRGPDGKDYSCYGIGWSGLAVPAYIIGTYLGNPEGTVSLLNPVLGAASIVLVFFFSLSLGYSSLISLAVSFFYALGTIAWPLSKQPFDHMAETLFILLSVLLLHMHHTERKSRYIMLSGLSLGVAFLVRYTALLMAPALFLMILLASLRRRERCSSLGTALTKTALFSAALLPSLGVALWYNYYRFGSVFETGFSLISTRAGHSLFQDFGATPLLEGLEGLLVSPGKGFFFYSPVAVLFFISIRPFAAKHIETAVCFLAGILSYLFFHAKFGHWSGDWAWGPRYLLAVTPFFLIPVAELLCRAQKDGKSLLRALLASVFLLSLLIQTAAVSVDFQNYFIDLSVFKKVKFTFTRNEGVPSNSELPTEVYFDWSRSPILAQMRFVKNIAGGITHYHYVKAPPDASLSSLVRSAPSMNIFDFWWLYDYILDQRISGIIVAFCLILLAGRTITNIRKTLRATSDDDGSK